MTDSPGSVVMYPELDARVLMRFMGKA